MGLIRLGLEQRQHSAHIPQHAHPVAERFDPVIENSDVELYRPLKEPPPHTVFHAPIDMNTMAAASPNCGLKIRHPRATPARNSRLSRSRKNISVKQASATAEVWPQAIK